MAHELSIRANGKAEMAYVGAKPWHGLGQELQQGASIEEWQIAAGMDWTIQRSRVRFATGRDQATQEFATWDDYNVLMRSDTKAPLGMVSSKFKIVQPKNVLEFYRDMAEAFGVHLETAGTLYGGRKFWALANLNAKDRIVGNDLVKAYLLLASAADGSMHTIFKNVATRVVCSNTQSIALGEKGCKEVKVSHRTTFDERQVKADMGLSIDAFHRFIMNARKLAERKVSPQEASEIICTATGDNYEAMERTTKVIVDEPTRAYKAILSLFNGDGMGSTLPGVAGTAWGAVNAVTEYYDHHKPTRTDSARLNSAWFGAGDVAKQNAMDKAMAFVN